MGKRILGGLKVKSNFLVGLLFITMLTHTALMRPLKQSKVMT